MSTYALIVVTVISLVLFIVYCCRDRFQNHLPAFLDKIKVYKRDGLKNHHNHSKSSRYTYCYCIFFLCLPLPQILYFYKLFLLSRVVGNNNLIQFLNSLVTQENCQIWGLEENNTDQRSYQQFESFNN